MKSKNNRDIYPNLFGNWADSNLNLRLQKLPIAHFVKALRKAPVAYLLHWITIERRTFQFILGLVKEYNLWQQMW